ncbi:MAG: hypothetical protein ACREAX_00820 [Candidatus Nitrosotenuis sp.]
MSKRYIYTLPVAFFLLLYILVSACDGGDNNECNGNLFDVVGPCATESITNLAMRGIVCEQCTSDLRPDEFSLSFNIEPPSTDVLFDNTFIVEPIDCDSFNLFEDTSGQPVGQIDGIQVIDPDDLLLNLKLDGQEPEQIFCDFCFVGPRPECSV